MSIDQTNVCANVGKVKTLLQTSGYFYEKTERGKFLEGLTQAISLDPKNAETYTVQGDAFMKFYMYEEAVTAYEKAIKYAVSFTCSDYIRKGDALYNLERYVEAMDTFDFIIQEMPHHAYAHKRKGDALYQLEQYNDALAHYEKAISLDYSNASIYTQKGNTLFRLNFHQTALAAYERAIELGSDFEKVEAYRGKGNVLDFLAQKAYKTADELRDSFLPDYPDDIS